MTTYRVEGRRGSPAIARDVWLPIADGRLALRQLPAGELQRKRETHWKTELLVGERM